MRNENCTLVFRLVRSAMLVWIMAVGAFENSSAVAGTLAQFHTALGTIDVELFDREKPITVQNFIRYAQNDAYDNVFMHRWVPGFVVQGGGFRTTQTGGSAIEVVPQFETIKNEYASGRTISNVYGTIAMARASGMTNSATSQWFFNLADNSGLDGIDGGFTVFGNVLRGTNVLNRFNNIAQTNGIYRVRLDPPLDELPVLSVNPSLDDLVYVNVELLEVELRISDTGERVVSWSSIKDQTNHLEATSNPGEPWQSISSVQGTGERIEFVDTAWRGNSRLYRVRVDY